MASAPSPDLAAPHAADDPSSGRTSSRPTPVRDKPRRTVSPPASPPFPDRSTLLALVLFEDLRQDTSFPLKKIRLVSLDFTSISRRRDLGLPLFLTFGNALLDITVAAFLGSRSFQLLFQFRGRMRRGVRMQGSLRGMGERLVEVVLQ